MKKLSLLLTVGLLIMIQVACTDSTAPEENKEQAESPKHEDSNEKEEQKKTEEEQQQNEQENEDKKESDQPFKPLEPSEDAVSLEDSLSKKEQQQMPQMQAQGGNTKRSVSAGQTLANGIEDPSDGPLKDYRLVTFYGTPESENMGILGELEPEEYMEKLKEQAQAYSDADPDRPAVPTIELITTMAQNEPGPEGNYVKMTPEEHIRTYVELAEEHDALVLLDIQLGKDTVMEQVKMVEEWLKHPHVHLAIDTEFHVDEGERPGEDLGQVDGKEIQEAVEYVSELTEQNDLPDKFVLVHQFTGHVLTNKEAIQPKDNAQVAVNFDGWGDATDKQALYNKYIREEPNQYGGFKIFYDKDEPVMKPEDVIKLDPSPAIVNYQ